MTGRITSKVSAKIALCGLIHCLTAIHLSANATASDEFLGKNAILLGVYSNLAENISDGRPAPQLEFITLGSPQERLAATYFPNEDKIYIAEKVYDICQSVAVNSDKALAAVLAHELIHYYRGHGWVGEYGVTISGLLDPGLSHIAAMEAQADLEGLFYAHVAGYWASEIWPSVIKGLYSGYHWPENIAGYLTLSDRLRIAAESQHKLQGLASVFDSANYLLTLKEFRLGEQLFEYLLRKFPSREIFNNAGVAIVSQALSLSSDDLQQFAFPFELDSISRLRSPLIEPYAIQSKPSIDALLAKASKYFSEALKRDARYLPAQINLAAVHILQGKLDSAKQLSSDAYMEAEKQKRTLIQADALTIKGIIDALNGNNSEAVKRFESASNFGRRHGKLNLALMKNANADLQSSQLLDDSNPSVTETINGFTPKQVSSEGLELVSLAISPVSVFHLREFENSYGVILESSGGNVYFVRAGASYPGATAKGVRIGSHEDAVRSGYGLPGLEVETPSGRYLVYMKRNIIFLIKQGIVVEWVLFDM